MGVTGLGTGLPSGLANSTENAKQGTDLANEKVFFQVFALWVSLAPNLEAQGTHSAVRSRGLSRFSVSCSLEFVAVGLLTTY